MPITRYEHVTYYYDRLKVYAQVVTGPCPVVSLGEYDGKIFSTFDSLMELVKVDWSFEQLESILNHHTYAARGFYIRNTPINFFSDIKIIDISSTQLSSFFLRMGNKKTTFSRADIVHECLNFAFLPDTTAQDEVSEVVIPSPPVFESTTLASLVKHVETVIGPGLDHSENKRDIQTYFDESSYMKYLRSTIFKRIYDVYAILLNIKSNLIIAPGDSCGVAYMVCRILGKKCLSSDLSPFAISLSQKLGADVALQSADHAIDLNKTKGGVLFISHLVSLIPNLVIDSLALNYDLIVYEHETVYSGMDKLIEPILNFGHLRLSSLSFWRGIPMKFPLMNRFPSHSAYWIDFYDPNRVYAIREPSCFNYISLLLKWGASPKIFPCNLSVSNLLDYYKISAAAPTNNMIGLHTENLFLGSVTGGIIEDSFDLRLGYFMADHYKNCYKYPCAREIKIHGPVMYVHGDNSSVNLKSRVGEYFGKYFNYTMISNSVVIIEKFSSVISGTFFCFANQLDLARVNTKSTVSDSEIIEYKNLINGSYVPLPRGLQIKGLIPLSVATLLVDKKGFNFSVRSFGKKYYPGYLDFTAGGYKRSGPSACHEANRELMEEQGVMVQCSEHIVITPEVGAYTIHSVCIAPPVALTPLMSDIHVNVVLSDKGYLNYRGPILPNLEVFMKIKYNLINRFSVVFPPPIEPLKKRILSILKYPMRNSEICELLENDYSRKYINSVLTIMTVNNELKLFESKFSIVN